MNRFRFRSTCSSSATYLAIPTIQDEKDTYTRWGWSWNASQEPANIADPYVGTYSVTDPDIHGDTEGDDLWTYLQMSRRGGAAFYLTRANAWLSYFQSGKYRLGTGQTPNNTWYTFDRDNYGGDHTYGWGLLLDYEINGTMASLTEAQLFAVQIETLWNASLTTYSCVPNDGCMHYGIRLMGRQINFIARLYEITLASRWLTLLTTMKNTLLNNWPWDDTYGMYFVFDGQAEGAEGYPQGEYANHGLRVVSSFQVGPLTEGMFNTWRITGDTAIRARLIRMADFVSTYGLDAEYGYSGTSYGVRDGLAVHYETFHEIISSKIAIRSSGSDTRQVTIYGRDASDANISETLTLNGTTDVLSTLTYRRYNRATVASSSGTRTISFRAGAGGVTLKQRAGGSFIDLVIATGATSTLSTTSWNPQYTTAAVNLLVLAYKFTGNTAYLTRAKTFFNNGTKGIYGSSTLRDAADNAVSHFVDTRFASATSYFYIFDNKGELQFTYLIFENGGLPTVYGTDTTAPSVSMTTPNSGSTVVGSSVTVSATANDNIAVAGVQFKLDGSNLNAEVTAPPYTTQWNSTLSSNGSHSLAATARDTSNNQATSTSVSVTVNNPASSSTLATAAAALSAGQWADITNSNFDTDVTWSYGTGQILQYAEAANWDPVSKQFIFMGGAHANGPNQSFAFYDDNTNLWRMEPRPPYACPPSNNTDCVRHAYCTQTIDILNGDFYHMLALYGNPVPIWKYNIATKSWGSTPFLTLPYAAGAVMGVVWFPDMGASGSLIIAGNSSNLYRWDKATATWSNMTGTGYAMGDYHNIAKYSPTTHKVIFGGGNSSGKLWEMDSSGTVTARADAPQSISPPDSTTVVDPVNGNYLNFKRDVNGRMQFTRGDTHGENWSSNLSNPVTNFMSYDYFNWNMVSAPISTYGCVMFLAAHNVTPATTGNQKVFIYKGGA